MADMSGEYAGHGRMQAIFIFQELCAYPCNMGPCIIMLKHEVMAADEWHDNGLQDLVHDLRHLSGTVETRIYPEKSTLLQPVAIKGEHLPTEVGYDAELQSGQDPGEDDEHTR
jgi:hypothetical protein